MVLRFLGESVTDSNGLAVLPDGYTGTGAGSVDIIAQTTIDESTVVSQPSSVYDCMWYDKGLSGDGNHNDNYSGIANLTRSDTGTILDTSSTWNQAKPKINNSDNINIGTGLCFEFDVVEFNANSGQIRCTVYDGSNRVTVLNGTGHYKFLVTDKIYCYKDGSTTPFVTPLDYDTTRGNVQIIFTNSVTGSTFKFKEYKIYPI